jgi:hypothetical protein
MMRASISLLERATIGNVSLRRNGLQALTMMRPFRRSVSPS